MRHPLFEAVACVRTALASVRDVQPVYLGPELKTELMRELAAAKAQVDELELRLAAACSDAAAATGAKDVGAWLAATLPLEARVARATARLAVGVEAWPQVQAALAAGALSAEQARVIVVALDEVHDLLTDDQRARAEALMVAEAGRLDPGRLRVLGRRLASLVGVDDGPAAEALLLAAEEAAADRRARFALLPAGDGMTRILGLVPDATAHRLRTCVEAFAQPRRMAYEADGRRIPYPKLLADALGDLMERLDPAILPHHGGDATTVFVTLTLDQLRSELATADLGLDGAAITAAQARRLACEAQLIPVVLGGQGEILDLGRQTRLHTPAMRKALRLRDRRCRAEGCTVPATWCQAHHDNPWALGGETDLKTGVLLCQHHHQRAHDPTYAHDRLPNGDYRFHRRT